MPNGDPGWKSRERPGLEKFFGRIAGTLKKFARRHNLALQKYYHQFPSWDFTFRHPHGGLAKIEVHKRGDDRVEIPAGWWVDDYGKCIRSLKKSEKVVCSLESGELKNLLEHTLLDVCSWQVQQLVPVDYEYKQWRRFTKDDFDQEVQGYPMPRLD